MLIPFKEHLVRSHSRRVTQKIEQSFAKVVSGLVHNTHISCENLLCFIYGIMSESITDLLPGTKKRELSEKEKEKMRRARPDCLIIPSAPKRTGAANKQAKTNAQANSHILIELSLELMHTVLNRKKLKTLAYEAFINPLLPLMSDALTSTHLRVTTFALRCFTSIWNLSYELPALRNYISLIVERIFLILRNYSTFGASRQGENAQIVYCALKSVVALLSHYKEYVFTENQIIELIVKIEQDLYEADNKPMGYKLLKALICAKVDTKALHDIIKQVGELSITSQLDYIRDVTRDILVTYIMEYPLQKKRINQLIDFMSVQLAYTLSSGRLSAIAFMQDIIRKFPQQLLMERSSFLFVTLAMRLVNDEDSDCRRAVAETLEALLSRFSKEEREPLLDIALTCLDNHVKPSIREMGAALISRFAAVEKSSFSARLPKILPKLICALTLRVANEPGRFVRPLNAIKMELDATDIEAPRKKRFKPTVADALLTNLSAEERVARRQRALDHQIIQTQYCLLKIFDNCAEELYKNEKLIEHIDELAYESQKFLAHEHQWVRANAIKLLNQILLSYDFDYIGAKLESRNESVADTRSLTYLYAEPNECIKSLVLDLCAQIIPGETQTDAIEDIAKIFLLIGNMLRNVRFKIKPEEGDEHEDAALNPTKSCSTKINVSFLVRNIRFLIISEVAKAPHSTCIRTTCFNLIEGLLTLLTKETAEKLAPMLLMPIVRETNDDDQNVEPELRRLALKVGARLRKVIGSDSYDRLRINVQNHLMLRRAERRKIVDQEKISDPVRAAKRKAAIQERKKATKRQKTELMRGKLPDTKGKLKKRKRKEELDIF